MRSRSTVRGLGVGLCFAWTTLSLPAFAQTQGDEGPAPAATEDSGAAAAPDANSTGNDDADKPEEGAAASTDEKPGPPRAPTVAPAPPKVAAEDEANQVVGVNILPGSGYPEPRVRGIKGGSLWLTIPGYQWPYMPKVAGRPGLQFALSGSVWVDTAYARIDSGVPTDPSLKRWTNQGRGVFRATPTYSTEDGWFVQGQMELVAQGDQYLPSTSIMGGVDDLYVRAGKWNVFDVTAGRIQGWEIYHYGMGLDLNTLERQGAVGRNNPLKPPQIYGVNFFWDRPNGGAGDYAIHVYPTDFLRLEVLGQIGAQSGSNVFAVRPVGILDLGIVKVKAGGEYGKVESQQDTGKDSTTYKGIGGAAQFVLNPYIEGGINYGIGWIDSINYQGLPDTVASTTTKSIGGFLNGRVYGPLIVGLGANWTNQTNLEPNGMPDSPNFGLTNRYDHFQGFFAVQYSVWDRLFFKFVGSRASFSFDDRLQFPAHSFTNGMWGGRLRMMYLF